MQKLVAGIHHFQSSICSSQAMAVRARSRRTTSRRIINCVLGLPPPTRSSPPGRLTLNLTR